MGQLTLWLKEWDNFVLRTITVLTLDDDFPNLMFSYIAIYQTAFLASNQDSAPISPKTATLPSLTFCIEGVAPVPSSQY